MSDFNITVDTSEMAESLDYVNSNVRNVTSSVVAMQSAVVLAQQNASENICRNVDTGFYLLMKSQFDQKIAAVSSEMLSRMQLMESFKEQIDKIMLTMQDDYDRIKNRYKKHFSSLDKSLDTRIHELDKRAYEISNSYKMSQFKNGGEVIKAILYADDTQLLNVKEVNATVKNKSARSIGVMADDVVEQLKYSGAVKNILKDASPGKAEEEYTPVIFTESDSMISAGTSVKNLYVPDSASFAQDLRYINELRANEGNLQWKENSAQTFENVRASFQKKVHGEIKDERIASEMLRLFHDSKWDETDVSLPGEEASR